MTAAARPRSALCTAAAVLAALTLILLPSPALAEGILRTVLVIDASSSMRSTDPKEIRKVAAELYVDLTHNGDQIAVTGFDGGVRESTGSFTTIQSAADREALKRAVRAVGNDGSWTDFTAGLSEARRLLDAAPDEPGDQELVLFLTDGRCDPDPKGPLAEAARAAGGGKRAEELCQDRVLNEIQPSLGRARVYAIGLSKGAPRAFLENLGRKSGGVGVATDRAEELPRLFAGVYARLLGSRLTEGSAAPAIDIPVGEGALSIDVVLVGPPSLTAKLVDPAGTDIPTDNRNAAEASFVDTPAYRLFKVARPAPGLWKLAVGGGGKGGMYAALQNLDLRLELLDMPEVIEVGRELPIRARLATPGGKVPALEFLDRHELTLRTAMAPSQCLDALRAPGEGAGPPERLRRNASGIYETRRKATARGEICVQALLSPGSAGVLTRSTTSPVIRVIPPIHLAATAPPFGSIKQGERGRSQITYAGSEIGEPIEAELVLEGLPAGVAVTPTSLRLASDPAGGPVIDIELAADRDAKSGPLALKGAIVPRKPKGYEGRAVPVSITATIIPLTFWERYGFWIKVGAGSLTALLLLIGIVTPARFRKGTVLHYKDSRDPDLPREATYPLAARAKAGFYRSARILMAPTGPVRTGGIVELSAGPGGGVLVRPLGGRKAREVPRDDESGMGATGMAGGGREVPLKKGVFRASAGVRYAIEGSGLSFWVTPR